MRQVLVFLSKVIMVILRSYKKNNTLDVFRSNNRLHSHQENGKCDVIAVKSKRVGNRTNDVLMHAQ